MVVQRPAEPPPGSHVEGGAVVAELPRRLRVLVVEDYPDAADSLALLLGLWGHEAHVCRTGPEALQATLANRPDVALVDLMLPGIDGYQVARSLREGEGGGQNTLLLAVTGLGNQEDRRRSQEAGFALHLLKPVDPDELQGILTTWAQRTAT